MRCNFYYNFNERCYFIYIKFLFFRSFKYYMSLCTIFYLLIPSLTLYIYVLALTLLLYVLICGFFLKVLEN